MKKILISLAMIVAVLSVMAGATYALFSDQGTVAGNTVATGTLELTVNKSEGKPWNVSGIQPGYVSGWEHVDLFNAPHPAVSGQLPFEAYMRLEGPTSGDVALYNALEIDVYDSGWNSDCGDEDDNLIYSGPLSGLTGSSNRTQTSDDDPNSSGPGDDNVMPGNSQRICQRIRFPDTGGDQNALQGKSVTFDEWFDAVQDND